jgi:catechol 2,3-dioxygenase
VAAVDAAHAHDMTMLGIDHVSYVVRDMGDAVAFYENVLGLHEVGATPDRSFVALSWGDNVHDIALMTGASTARGSVHHVAITLQGGPDDLRAFARELRDRGVELEMALDHLVSRSVYFRDPDGNRIEVFVDMPRAAWEHIPGAIAYGAPLSVR